MPISPNALTGPEIYASLEGRPPQIGPSPEPFGHKIRRLAGAAASGAADNADAAGVAVGLGIQKAAEAIAPYAEPRDIAESAASAADWVKTRLEPAFRAPDFRPPPPTGPTPEQTVTAQSKYRNNAEDTHKDSLAFPQEAPSPLRPHDFRRPVGELVFPSDTAHHIPSASQASEQARRNRTNFAAESLGAGRLRFPEAQQPQGADSMDRLAGRSAENGFSFSPYPDPPGGRTAAGPRQIARKSVDEMVGEADSERDASMAALAQEMGLDPNNRINDRDVRASAAIRARAPAPPAEDKLFFPMAPGQAESEADASAARRIGMLTSGMRAIKERREADAAAEKLRADAEQARASQKQAAAAKAAKEESARKAKEAQEASARKASERQAALDARAAREEEGRRAEEQRRRAPIGDLAGVPISPLERAGADVNISGRYSGPLGSRMAPRALSERDIRDITGGVALDFAELAPDENGDVVDVNYGMLADKMGLPADMPEDERAERAKVFLGDQLSRSQNSSVKRNQDGSYFAPSPEARGRYGQRALVVEASKIKERWPRNQSGGQEHFAELDDAVANGDSRKIGEIRRRLYDEQNAAAAAFIRDRGRAMNITRNITDPRVAPGALATALENARTPEDVAMALREFGLHGVAEPIDARAAAAGEARLARENEAQQEELNRQLKREELGTQETIAGMNAAAAGAELGRKDKLANRELDIDKQNADTNASEAANRAKALEEQARREQAREDAERAATTAKNMGAGDYRQNERKLAVDRLMDPEGQVSPDAAIDIYLRNINQASEKPGGNQAVLTREDALFDILRHAVVDRNMGVGNGDAILQNGNLRNLAVSAARLVAEQGRGMFGMSRDAFLVELQKKTGIAANSALAQMLAREALPQKR